ncbi:TlpA family protein disulfide reductase [Halalkalibaculum sp. DA3122]|uniref:TlpA family protein disulfide reductase n=1 Tax=Halalkalibaculum sp. DA3122 TaxID=3373607 RepID=UPI003755149E
MQSKSGLFPVLLVTAGALLLSACTFDQQQVQPSAPVMGTITVADSVDSSRDFSGIEVSITKKDSAQADADTLFFQVTDSTGHFSGVAMFPEKQFYTLRIDRNQQQLGQASVILADGDTLRIEAELPGFQQALTINSAEHEALGQYRRVNQNYQRVVSFIQRGVLKGDSARTELQKFADLYWEIYENKTGTLASRMAAVDAIDIYGSLDGRQMMQKLREVQDNDQLAAVAARYGTSYLAENKGLNHTLQYLDSLQTITEDSVASMNIQQEQIKLLYDSARVDQAKSQLAEFKKRFGDNRSVKSWVEGIEYDLNYLSPGDTIPPFAFKNNGKLISRDSLLGTPYILEITLLSNRLYQNQYDRTFVIHNIYKNFGLEVVTIPLDQSQVTIDAFFSEREKAWPVASAEAFDRQSVIEKFNIRLVPTRFLVDRNGEIVRKYIGEEYQDVIQGIQTIIKTEEPAS